MAINYWSAKHYARNLAKLKGAFMNKEKHLKEIGLDVVSISEMELKALADDEKQEFFIKKINSNEPNK